MFFVFDFSSVTCYGHVKSKQVQYYFETNRKSLIFITATKLRMCILDGIYCICISLLLLIHPYTPTAIPQIQRSCNAFTLNLIICPWPITESP